MMTSEHVNVMAEKIQNTTFIIKTFERPHCVKRLVGSILKVYPEANIFIADDSRVSCKTYFEKKYSNKNIKVYELEYDSGLAHGRNYLLNRVTTKYFVLLDDDFEFDDKTDIVSGIDLLEEKKLSILGGYFRNYEPVRGARSAMKRLLQDVFCKYRAGNYIGNLDFNKSTGELHAHYIRNRFPDYTDTDITHNFFIAVTDVIRENNLWDEELKLHEHTAFFLKAKKNNLRVGFTNRISVKHKPILTSKYRRLRDRSFIKDFMRLYGVKKFIYSYDDGKMVVLEYETL